MAFSRLRSAQAFAVLPVLKDVHGVDGRIAGLIRNAFGIHGWISLSVLAPANSFESTWKM